MTIETLEQINTIFDAGGIFLIPLALFLISCIIKITVK